ncbi:hypothetical protein FQA47_006250 [Oryzias melastigma]|uniref:Uncharacterized protein n=1 Tax=Oryzias melastigma TaxID=30732 RepID=A0A834FP08_ORYME|nr:hypothetical protein FQA47_016531 [Oryzias melastigma]KAF6737735.1 hypothetical protein FQA47_006250 [Oryzias melastigma]
MVKLVVNRVEISFPMMKHPQDEAAVIISYSRNHIPCKSRCSLKVASFIPQGCSQKTFGECKVTIIYSNLVKTSPKVLEGVSHRQINVYRPFKKFPKNVSGAKEKRSFWGEKHFVMSLRSLQTFMWSSVMWR